jgi:hypothetical protein
VVDRGKRNICKKGEGDVPVRQVVRSSGPLRSLVASAVLEERHTDMHSHSQSSLIYSCTSLILGGKGEKVRQVRAGR